LILSALESGFTWVNKALPAKVSQTQKEKNTDKKKNKNTKTLCKYRI
jgi:hypothetical protein